MLQLKSPPYVCWICLSGKRLSGSSVRILPGRLSAAQSFRPIAHPTVAARAARTLATVQHSDKPSLPQDPFSNAISDQKPSEHVNIRDRLRAWEAENPEPAQLIPRDHQESGAAADYMPQSQSPFMVEVETDSDAQDFNQHLYDGDDLVDLRSNAAVLQAGDLVEISSSAWRIQLLAVCLGEFNGYQHFYTNTGKWFTTHGVRTLFTVKGFADASEIGPVADSLPSKSASVGLLNILQDLKAGPSRHVGAGLIRKMNSFLDDTRFIYQSNAGKLDNAFRYLGGDEKSMALADIAGVLLHKGFKKRDRFTPAALYAVHRALLLDDVGFRPASRVDHTQTYLFEITSEADVKTIDKVEMLVQKHYEQSVSNRGKWSDDELEASVFGGFLLKARKAIDDGRRSRMWSPHGTLRTSSIPASPILPGWTDLDLELIQFMHMWAASEKFGSSSQRHWIGSAILRALGRYQDCEYLDQAVAWTFLQEIGWVKPWEIQARYRLRLTGVQLERGGGVKTTEGALVKSLLKPDIFSGRRKDFAKTRVFCIDAESASDIDDGVSLEPTETPGEYWIHVHVADPTSSIRVDSPLANQAALVPQTVYLPGHFSRMLDNDIIRKKFSLAAGRPSLTFSAKVNTQGALLDYKITPAFLRNVTYITGDAVSAACGEESPQEACPREVFAVGKASATKLPPNRHMTKAEDLSAKDIDDLQTLSRLAKAIRGNRLDKGAMPTYLPTPSVTVSFQGVEVNKSPDGFMRCSGDPYIKIAYDSSRGNPIVDGTMQLAGEVAARWCHERGIPIPYRVQPRAAQNMDLLRKFTREVFYPQLASGQRPSEENWQVIRTLSGGYDISTTPTPHFTMGIDMYTKVTSPLRRYADMLVHWQIQGALLEEERRGGSLVGNTDDSFLPFGREELEQQVFPMLRVRERHAVLLDRSQGTGEWMLQALVRAWRFGDAVTEGAALPPTFRFTVADVVEKRVLKGRLDWFDRPALMQAEGLVGAGEGGASMRIADVNVGDVFEVELSDVVVCKRRILVKALRRVENMGGMISRAPSA